MRDAVYIDIGITITFLHQFLDDIGELTVMPFLLHLLHRVASANAHTATASNRFHKDREGNLPST